MIRQASATEAPLLAALVERAYVAWVPVVGRRPMPMDDDYAARVAAGEAFVLERDGAIAGLVVIEHHADHVMLDNIAVEPALAGQGDGRILLDFVEAETRRRGLAELRLYTNALMARNIALYERRGFVETGRHGPDGFRRVFMTKRLTP